MSHGWGSEGGPVNAPGMIIRTYAHTSLIYEWQVVEKYSQKDVSQHSQYSLFPFTAFHKSNQRLSIAALIAILLPLQASVKNMTLFLPIYITAGISERQDVEECCILWEIAAETVSILQTTLHFHHQHISFYCLSTRGNSLLLIATLMTILLSCKITNAKKKQVV